MRSYRPKLHHSETVVLASQGFQNVGMTTETFSNQLKSHRKAEAFRGKVIKMKQGRGEANGGGTAQTRTPL